MASARARYDAIGHDRGFFAAAAVLVVVGLLAPAGSTSALSFFTGYTPTLHIWDLGFGGYAWAAIMMTLALPLRTPGRALCVTAVALSGASFGMVFVLLQISAMLHQVFSIGPGLWAWAVASAILAYTYAQRTLAFGGIALR